jgi:hypothetical protein
VALSNTQLKAATKHVATMVGAEMKVVVAMNLTLVAVMMTAVTTAMEMTTLMVTAATVTAATTTVLRVS